MTSAGVDRRFFETLLASKKLSLRSVAAKMDRTHSQLSLILSGQRRMQLDEAVRFAEIFNVPLSRIVDAAGVGSGRALGRRVEVIGAVRDGGIVEMHQPGVIERAVAPEGLPDNVVAVQARTHGTPSSWMDGFVYFSLRTEEVEPDAIGRFCLAKVENGPSQVVLATVSRGYREGTYNLTGPYSAENKRLIWAAPILLVRT